MAGEQRIQPARQRPGGIDQPRIRRRAEPNIGDPGRGAAEGTRGKQYDDDARDQVGTKPERPTFAVRRTERRRGRQTTGEDSVELHAWDKGTM